MSLVCVGETCPEGSAGHIPWNNCGRNIPWTSIIIFQFSKDIIRNLYTWIYWLTALFRPQVPTTLYKEIFLPNKYVILRRHRSTNWSKQLLKFYIIGFPPAFSPRTGGMKPGLRDHWSATHIWTRPTRTQKIELYFIMEKYISYTCQVWNKTTQGKARSNRRFIALNRMGDKCVWYHLSAYHREINQLTSQNMSWNIRSYVVVFFDYLALAANGFRFL